MRRTSAFKTRMVWLAVVTGVLAGGNAEADFTLGTPVNLGPPVNTASIDQIPRLSADGLELYFDSDRPGSYGYWDLYVSVRDSEEAAWGTPQNLGPVVNSPRPDGGAFLSVDGLEFYFHSHNRPGGRGSFDIWMTRRETRDAPWREPVNLGSAVNGPGLEGFPNLSPDGLELYFGSDRSGGYGDGDIWVASRSTIGAPWETPVNLGPVINGPAEEAAVFLSRDGLLLLFSEDVSGPFLPGGQGKADLWLASRRDLSDPWTAPVNLGPRVNSQSYDYNPMVSPDKRTLYFCSDRPGGRGSLDIYQAGVIPVVDLNGDGKVNGADILVMVDSWGVDDRLCDIGPTPWGDGVVDLEDLKVLAEHIGQPLDDPTLTTHWALDEAEGIVAHDSAGGNDGTLMGTPVWEPAGGAVGGALEFDGASAFLVTDCVVRSADGPFSILAWIKGGGPGQVVISQQGGGDWLYANPADGTLATECAGRVNRPLLSNAVITDGQWHRIGITWDGSHRRLYVDGEEVAIDTQNGLASSDGRLVLGTGSHLASGTFFSGLIDDVRIYNRAVNP